MKLHSLRQVSRAWYDAVTPLLFEMVSIVPARARTAANIATSAHLARHVRICEYILCAPTTENDENGVDQMYLALAIRDFTHVRELILVFVHDWVPDHFVPHRREHSELRRAILSQIFFDIQPHEFHADSFVRCMHEFDGSRAPGKSWTPGQQTVIHRWHTLKTLDLCLVLEDEHARVFYDFQTLGHYVARIVAGCSQTLSTLSLCFSASPHTRLRRFDHIAAPFLDRITLPRLQVLFLEDMRMAPVELSDFVVEHLGPKSLLQLVHVAGVLMPPPPEVTHHLDFGGWAQFCRDLSPYAVRPVVQLEQIGYEKRAPLRPLDLEWIERTIAPTP
ncbi:hypothetical protein BKA62DRAFT_750451 [Auriculariales sp. MPI-PUGE-AT-0066]|nr:hypothetical protein BKA62DRAFT_750451 [Auriculariales sp. MPI-PUGE-AT-0066]